MSYALPQYATRAQLGATHGSDMPKSALPTRQRAHNPTMEIFPKPLCPEQALCIAILDRVLNDAMGMSDCTHTRLKDRNEARHYISRVHQDLADVCDGAGIEPRYFVQQAQRLMKEGRYGRA